MRRRGGREGESEKRRKEIKKGRGGVGKEKKRRRRWGKRSPKMEREGVSWVGYDYR